MKPYQVVGIGNALVDVICPVEDGFLDANGVTKGVMQLIDLDRSAELYAAMGPATVITAIVSCPRRFTGAAIAVMPGAYCSTIRL